METLTTKVPGDLEKLRKPKKNRKIKEKERGLGRKGPKGPPPIEKKTLKRLGAQRAPRGPLSLFFMILTRVFLVFDPFHPVRECSAP